MNELDILRGIAIIIAFGRFIVPALIIGAVCEWWDKRSHAKTKKELEKRRAEFDRDCERVGKREYNIDQIHRTVAEFGKRQNITCKGYFHGKAVEKYIRAI